MLEVGLYKAPRYWDVVGVVFSLCGETGDRLYARGPNAAAGDDEVVAGAHASYCFDYIVFIVRDDLDAL